VSGIATRLVRLDLVRLLVKARADSEAWGWYGGDAAGTAGRGAFAGRGGGVGVEDCT